MSACQLSSYADQAVPDHGEDYDSADDDRPLAVYDRLPSSFGLDRFVLTNFTRRSHPTDGIEFRGTGGRALVVVGEPRRTDRRRSAAIEGRSEENDQGLPGELLENPNAASYPRGHLFFDRSYVLKFGDGLSGASRHHVSAVARYQDGQPFSRLVVVQDLAQGAEVVTAYRAGRTRFTFTSTLDARLEKGFTFGRYRAAVRLEIFNLPNLGYEIEENPVTGRASSVSTTAVQPPRAVRVGFRLEF